ncbi:MAG: WD40 repeat domain-containing protein [Anaerolineae bacterium]
MADASSSDPTQHTPSSATSSSSNVSGGVNANNTSVGGDVTGRDKISQASGDIVGGDKVEVVTSPSQTQHVTVESPRESSFAPLTLGIVAIVAILGLLWLLSRPGTPEALLPVSTEAKPAALTSRTLAPVETTAPKVDNGSSSTVQPEPVTVTSIVISKSPQAPVSVPPAIAPKVDTTTADLKPGAPLTADNAKKIGLIAVVDTSGQQACWSPDGKWLALITSGVHLLDAKNLQVVQAVGAQGSANRVVFSPDSQKLAVAGSNGLVLWDVTGATIIRTFSSVKSAADVDFSPDGKLLAVPVDQAVKLLDVDTGSEVNLLVEHRTTVRLVKFSSTGKLLASVDPADGVKLWDVATGDELRQLNVQGFVNALAFSPDGQQLALGASWSLELWDVAKGELVRPLAQNDTASEVNSVAFSPDGKMLAVARGLTIRLIDVASGRELRVLKGHTTDVTSVAFSPDGGWLVSVANDVRIWGIP